RLKYEYGLDLCRPWLAGREVLDVGTGTGLFLNTARDHGFKAMGLELNDLGVARLREAGFEVIDRPLEEAGLESDCFDLITLWEVLEHIVEPGRLLLEISRIIRPQGLLLVLVPNTDSLVTRLLHEKSATFGGHSHVNFFNVSTLGRLLDQSGFQIVEAETVITELGTINNHLALEDPYFGRAEPVLDFLSPDLIHDRMLGSKLLVLARPKANQESGA
ncbi:MAG: class I SAM-dependent methyltransferase, partial [Proteobacteria bacterium]|nr:class I SAM-dependent methyltransferase [Pseudomonadota bacterium]